MSSQRPYAATPVHVPELAAALEEAWREELGMQPSREAILVLLAQWSLETAGGSRCINWNLGNMKSVAGDGCDWTEIPTWEMVNGQRVDVVARFRAFATLADGAINYVSVLSKRFAGAWPAVVAGDVEAFARELHGEHYYTAPVEAYVRGMLERRAALDAAWPAPASVDVTDGGTDNPVFVTPDPLVLETETLARFGNEPVAADTTTPTFGGDPTRTAEPTIR